MKRIDEPVPAASLVGVREEEAHGAVNSPFKRPHLVASGVSRIIIPWGIAV
jgi:hypothetical protein